MTKTLQRRVFSWLPVVISAVCWQTGATALPAPSMSQPANPHPVALLPDKVARKARTLYLPLSLFTFLIHPSSADACSLHTPRLARTLAGTFSCPWAIGFARPGTRTPLTLVLLRAPLAPPLASSGNKQPHAWNLSLCTFGCRLTPVANNVQKERLGGRCCGSFSCRMPAVLPCFPL